MILTVAETKAFENIYEESASFYREGQYFPLKVMTE